MSRRRIGSVLVVALMATFSLVGQSPAARADDPAPPETTITQHLPALTGFTVAYFVFTGYDPGGGPVTFQCTLDGVAFAEPCVSQLRIYPVAIGSHLFTVAAVNAAGVADPTPASWAWTVKGFTNLTVDEFFFDLQPEPTVYPARLRAQLLTGEIPGRETEPVPGRTVSFYNDNDKLLCGGVTDSTGAATCLPDPLLAWTVVAGRKNHAVFAGDDSYLPSSGEAQIFHLGL